MVSGPPLLQHQLSNTQRPMQHTSFPGMTPPQKPTSAQHWPCAVCRLISRFCKVVVGGIEFNGISTTVVIPPATAARVPVQKPSQSVRPGSFRWTWALRRHSHDRLYGGAGLTTHSTRPGRTNLSPASMNRDIVSPYGLCSVYTIWISVILPVPMSTVIVAGCG
jgi:hypothetical protein